MKNFIFNYKDSNGNEKNVELRLKSSDCEKIEKQQGCSLIDFVQHISVTNIVTMLQYMIEGGSGIRFSREQAYSLYDELVDAGYTIVDILDKIIYEALVVSGIIGEDNLRDIREEREKYKNMSTEEKQRLIEERKNVQK